MPLLSKILMAFINFILFILKWRQYTWFWPGLKICHLVVYNLHIFDLVILNYWHFDLSICHFSCELLIKMQNISNFLFFFKLQKSESESCSVMFNSLWVHGILQERILDWVAFPFSRGSSQPGGQTQVSHIAGGFFTKWAIKKAPSCRRVYSNGDLLRKPFNTEMEAEIPNQNGSWGYKPYGIPIRR